MHLKPNTISPCSLGLIAFNSAANDWLCRGCNWIRPSETNISLSIDAGCLNSVRLTFVNGTGITLAHSDLLSLFPGDMIADSFFVGSLTDKDGKPISSWKTLNAKARTIIRGKSNISTRVCSECARQVYFAQGRPYVVDTDFGGHCILGTDLYGMLFARELFDEISIVKKHGVEISCVQRLDEPLDGCGKLPFYAH